jgi:hypothetical protein
MLRFASEHCLTQRFQFDKTAYLAWFLNSIKPASDRLFVAGRRFASKDDLFFTRH